MGKENYNSAQKPSYKMRKEIVSPQEVRKMLKLVKQNVIFSANVNQHTLLWKVDGTWLGNHQQRANIGEW